MGSGTAYVGLEAESVMALASHQQYPQIATAPHVALNSFDSRDMARNGRHVAECKYRRLESDMGRRSRSHPLFRSRDTGFGFHSAALVIRVLPIPP